MRTRLADHYHRKELRSMGLTEGEIAGRSATLQVLHLEGLLVAHELLHVVLKSGILRPVSTHDDRWR